MVKASLVATDLAVGAEIFGILSRSTLEIKLAMWTYTPDAEDWRYVLSSPILDRAQAAAAYGLVHDALDEAGFPYERTPTLEILKLKDPFVRDMRRRFGKAKSVEGMRLGGQMIGGRYVEEAIVYRIQS